MLTSKSIRMRLALVLLMVTLTFSSMASVKPVSAANPPAVGVVCTQGPTFSLQAMSGYIQMPDMNTMYMWSYAQAGGTFQHPGPILCVNEGDTVTITLTNNLPNYLGATRTSLIFPGQENVLADGNLAQPDLANNSLIEQYRAGREYQL